MGRGSVGTKPSGMKLLHFLNDLRNSAENGRHDHAHSSARYSQTHVEANRLPQASILVEP